MPEQSPPTFAYLLSKLSVKYRSFVLALLDCLNQAEAARRAGYSEKTAREQASRLLTNVNIKAAFDAGLRERAMGRDEVLARLSGHASGDMRDFVKTDTDGDVFWIELSAEKPLHLIKKLKISKSTLGDRDDAPIVETKVEIELYDAQAALITLAKHHNLFKEAPGSGGVLLNLTPEQLAAMSEEDLAELGRKRGLL